MKNKYQGYIDFIKDDSFVQWRILPSEELNFYWDNFIQKHPEYENDIQIAIKKLDTIRIGEVDLNQDEIDKHYRRLILTLQQQKRHRRRKLMFYWSAACFAAFVLSVFFFSIREDSLRQDILVENNSEVIVGKILPSSDVQLITSQEAITLKQNEHVTLSKNGTVTITHDLEVGEEINGGTKSTILPDHSMSKLIVPYGKQTTLMLSDSTKVWINSGSEVEFPSSFNSDSRNIYVKGEIYVEVAYSENKPFYVHTSQFKVSVHGTKFNVSAYPDNNLQSVVLVEGKVEVAQTHHMPVVLSPHELLEIINDQQRVSQVDVLRYTSWKDGVLVLNKTTISDVLTKIGRYYNVEFNDKRELKLLNKSCSGKLVLSEDIDDVMSSVSKMFSVQYHIENETVFIKNK